MSGDHKKVIKGGPYQYIKLNVGGSLHYTTIGILTKHDNMLRAMFSGRMEVLTDSEGWVLIDRCGKHFGTILNFLRDESVVLPENKKELKELLAEARYYCINELVELCEQALYPKYMKKKASCLVPLITSPAEEQMLLESSNKPAIKLSVNRHNNKYSYTSSSDDNLLKNIELFERLALKYSQRLLFMKETNAKDEICHWTFYGNGEKIAEIDCTSLVYATDKKHTKIEFPDARIYEEVLGVIWYENIPNVDIDVSPKSQNAAKASSSGDEEELRKGSLSLACLKSKSGS